MRRTALAVLACVGLSSAVLSMWAPMGEVPVDRLLVNLRARVEEKPEDAKRHYQLGRACGLAYALHARFLRTVGRAPSEYPKQSMLVPLAVQKGGGTRGSAADRDAGEALDLLATAVREQRIAAEAEPQEAAYRLGLAYALASGAHAAASLDSAPLLAVGAYEDIAPDQRDRCDRLVGYLIAREAEPERLAEFAAQLADPSHLGWLDANRADPDPQRQAVVAHALTRIWRTRALREYAEAYDLAWPTDSRRDGVDWRGDHRLGIESLVAHEAATAILQLVERPELSGVLEPERVQVIREGLTALDALPAPNWITPIVLRFNGATALADHLAPECVVSFDLDGDGRAERRTWVRPDTGLVVWDPEGRGEVTSGRQLFGSATWWMFFRDGYEALDALDDDRDGWLFGRELDGLALWRDADVDAVSDPGEVEGLACLGVVALATRPDTLEGLAPGARRGAWLSDGRSVPTWDWVAEPVPEPPQASAPELVSDDGDGARATYAVREIEGWKVHVDEAVGPDALELLEVKLFDVRRAVPAAALAKLRRVPIWLSAADTACACACYHVSAEWLAENGHDPAKARAVEITRADLFLDWSRDQPSMVLHELAHALFDRELSPRQLADLELALARARAGGLYDSVLRASGLRERHYALGNAGEFFAEMSESWLGTNDYWPFVRAELVDADPQTAALVAELWGA